MTRAERTAKTAGSIASSDPESAYVLAYDAMRYACTALLAQQGLRPTSSGGHYAVERSVRAQFGAGFRGFGAMRRRRHELEYPSAAERADARETEDAIASARALIAAAAKLVPALPMF